VSDEPDQVCDEQDDQSGERDDRAEENAPSTESTRYGAGRIGFGLRCPFPKVRHAPTVEPISGRQNCRYERVMFCAPR
jgi:hypothetical protein